MRMYDVMVPIKSDENIPASSCIDQSQNILSLNPTDILALPSVIPVGNSMGQRVGSIKRELLSFIYQSCNGSVLGDIMDRFEEGVIAIDIKGRIFYVNDAYTKILGVPKSKVLGMQMQTVEPGAAILKVCEDGEPILGKVVRVKTLNRYATVNIYPIKRENSLIAVVSVFRDVTEINQLNQDLDKAKGLADYFRQQLTSQNGLTNGSIIGRNPYFLKALSRSVTVAKTDASVLLLGENGVGKEVFAKTIHENSNRSNKPLISVNCAAIPENLLESELFGYEDGSFTGAKRGGKLGKFELANGGTLFLDEVGDMSAMMQSKLLRVLQEKEIDKIGRTRNIPVDVRIVAATNRPLDIMIQQGTFRSDLYYRLNVVSIDIPPLRDRGEDIGLLAHHFLQHYNGKYNKDTVLSTEVLRFFNSYLWPGNVRELQNCIEYTVIMSSEKEIHIGHLPHQMNIPQKDYFDIDITHTPDQMEALKEKVHSTEKAMIQEALLACENNKTKAMKMLGISRRTFYRKLKNYGLCL